MWPWHMWSEWGWGGMIVSGIFMLVIWGGILALAFLAIRALLGANQRADRPGPAGGDHRSALDTLNERYARGEISREEYREIRHDLEN